MNDFVKALAGLVGTKERVIMCAGLERASVSEDFFIFIDGPHY